MWDLSWRNARPADNTKWAQFLTSRKSKLLILLIKEVVHGLPTAPTQFPKDVKWVSLHTMLRTTDQKKCTMKCVVKRGSQTVVDSTLLVKSSESNNAFREKKTGEKLKAYTNQLLGALRTSKVFLCTLSWDPQAYTRIWSDKLHDDIRGEMRIWWIHYMRFDLHTALDFALCVLFLDTKNAGLEKTHTGKQLTVTSQLLRLRLKQR